MITDYIHAAMTRARFEKLDDRTYYGEIPGFPGVWGSSKTLGACRRTLQEVLEDWIVVSLQIGNKLPRLPGVRPFPRKRIRAAG